MKPTLPITFALLFLTPLTLFAADPAAKELAKPKDVSELLAPIIKKHDVPGMAVAVLRKGEIVATGVAGVRTRGKPEKIELNDRFHLGSDTKAMTAMLCGILVDEGKLKWTQTIGETFPDLKKSMHAQYQSVTLEQLLTNRSGAPHDIDNATLNNFRKLDKKPIDARRLLLASVTSKAPGATPGEKYIYSNAGFSIAGHMAEKVTKKSWEDLMKEKIFKPLKMTTAGFGHPGTPKKNDQPRGHSKDGKPIEPGPNSDNPVAIGPSGIVHCSIEDWAKFANENLPSATAKLVKPETLAKLHTPIPPAAGEMNYAMGWIVAGKPDDVRLYLQHNGSNTMWYASVWMYPNQDLAFLVTCNQANETACVDAFLAAVADFKGTTKK